MSKATANFKNKTQEELQKLLREKQDALRSFGFDISGSKITNVKQARNLRRDIARILTFLGANSEHEGSK